jgi:5-formyltetrahydrofolate cyclo-ligase
MYSKEEIRTIIKESKNIFPPDILLSKSISICSKIELLDCFINANTIVSYWPLAKEVDLTILNNKYSQKKTILLPDIADNEIYLKQYSSEDKLETGSLGIKVPVGKKIIKFEEIDLVLVPGIAFDTQGNRLGRGKGYYDRFLKKITAHKLGICFDFQQFDNIPINEYDVSVDEVIFS